MVNLLFLLVLHPSTLSGVVDRIEGDYAVVEWQVPGAPGTAPTLQYADIPLAVLPCPVAEGSHLRARTRPRGPGPLDNDFASAARFSPLPPLRASDQCSRWTWQLRSPRGGRFPPTTQKGVRKP